jgi:MFS family permease
MPAVGDTPPWRRDFHRLWAGESVSLLGSEVAGLALPLTAVTTLHASVGQLGLLGAASYLPFVVLGLPAGLWVDRVRRRPVLIAADLGQLLAIGAVPLLFVLGRLTFGGLLAAAMSAGAMRVFFLVAYRAYLPAVVPTANLTTANSRLTASESVAEIGGPGLGGLLVQLIGAPYALLVDAGSYAASVVGLVGVRHHEEQPQHDPAPLRTQVADGFRFTFASRYLRAFAGEAASYNLCWTIVQTVLVIFAVRVLGLTPGALGLALSIGALGALLGALFTSRISNRIGLGHTLVGAALIGDLAPLGLPFTPAGSWAMPLLATAFFVRGAGVTGCNVHVAAIRQTLIPEQLRGRTNASYLLAVAGVIPLGALLGGWLGTAIGLRPTLAVGTLGLLSTAMFLIFSPVRTVTRLTDIGPPDH